MTKHLTTAILFGLVSGAALAQSTVTLYGVADMSIERVKGAESLTRLASGQQQGSRWGLRGSEDLGNGLKTVFQLESGINMKDGTAAQGGRLFGRQAWVGLNGSFGSVRLGRQYSPLDDIAGIVGTKTYDVLSVVPIIGNGDYNRVNNAINYVSPVIANTTIQAQYGMGDGRSSSDGSKDFGKLFSVGAIYADGPLKLGLGVIRVLDADGAVDGRQRKNAVLATGSYDFGPVKLTAYFDQEDKAEKKLKVYGLAAAMPFGATTVSVGAAQARNVNGSVGSDDARLYTVQVSHNLSKRTAVYSHLTVVSNKGSAALGFNGPAAGKNSNGIQFGLRHRF